MDLLEGLNPPQREAVAHPGGPLLILAGAGSGKTRVLTHRIAHLIWARGVLPESIIAITFTNKAAGEMRERVDALVGEVGRRVWASTFHSACVRILRRHADRIGYARDFTIFDDADQQRLMRRILDEEGLDAKRFPPRGMLGRISDAKNRLETADAFAERAVGPLDEITARCYRRYRDLLLANQGMDFDDLLMVTVGLFDADAEVRGYYQQRFQHVLVDEYQDTNHAQYRLVRLLSEPQRNVTVVGDDDQGIYSWRGADVRNILDFERDYEDAHVIALEQNYRSTAHILSAANAVVSKVPGRRPKTLWTDLGDGAPIVIRRCRDEHEEARGVVEEVRGLLAAGQTPADLAVLYRTNAQSRVIEDALLRQGMLYQVIGGPKFYDRAEVKDLIAYLRVAVNPADSVSLERMTGAPKRGIGPGCIAKLQDHAQQTGVATGLLLGSLDEVAGLQTAQRAALGEVAALLDQLRLLDRAGAPVEELVEEALEGSGLRAAFSHDDDPRGDGRLQNLEELVRMAAQYRARAEEPSLGGFLEEIALFADADAVGAEVDRVTLMTMHNAKGLEYHTVVIVGLEEGYLPHSRSADDPNQLEEERRLAYVGLTRARRRLVLSHAAMRTVYGGYEPRIPSRFLSELPAQHLERPFRRSSTAPTSGGRVIGQTRWDPSVPAPTPAQPGLERGRAAGVGLEVGDSVLHARFGEGVIISSEPGGDLVAVRFADGSERRLMPSVAPMRKVVAA